MSWLPFGVRLLLTAAAAFTPAVTEAAPAIKRLDGTEVAPTVLTARIQELARKGNVHGLGVSVFNAGEPVYSRTFGVKRTDTKEPLTEDTVFYGASLSKAVFGVLVMRLVDDGLIDLDTPLVKYLEEPLDAREAALGEGVAREPQGPGRRSAPREDHGAHVPRPHHGLAELALVRARPEAPDQDGARHALQLLRRGPDLAAGRPRAAHRRTLEDLAKEKIFAPYGMTRSSYTWQPRFEARLLPRPR